MDSACKIYCVNISVARIMLEKPLETLQRVDQKHNNPTHKSELAQRIKTY